MINVWHNKGGGWRFAMKAWAPMITILQLMMNLKSKSTSISSTTVDLSSVFISFFFVSWVCEIWKIYRSEPKKKWFHNCGWVLDIDSVVPSSMDRAVYWLEGQWPPNFFLNHNSYIFWILLTFRSKIITLGPSPQTFTNWH